MDINVVKIKGTLSLMEYAAGYTEFFLLISPTYEKLVAFTSSSPP